MTETQLESVFFENWSEACVKVLDGVFLYGCDFFEGEAVKEKLEGLYKKYLVDVLMGIRHYITVDKAKEKLTYKRIETYILKALLFPLRMERYCVTGVYPISKEALLHSCEGDLKEIVAYSIYPERFEEAVAINHKDVLSKLHGAVEALL